MVDAQCRIVLVNRQTEALFGYRREELLGLAVEILVPSSVREKHPALGAEFLRDPNTREMGAGRVP